MMDTDSKYTFLLQVNVKAIQIVKKKLSEMKDKVSFPFSPDFTVKNLHTNVTLEELTNAIKEQLFKCKQDLVPLEFQQDAYMKERRTEN